MLSAASVCQFVCLFVNTITSERLNVGMQDDETWRLGAVYKNLADFKFGGQRSKVKVTMDKKNNEKCDIFSGSGPRGRVNK